MDATQALHIAVDSVALLKDLQNPSSK
jgi:hypothetical protein